jgi:hypothetical protein
VAFVDPTAGLLTWWISIVLMSIVIQRHFGDTRNPYGTEPAHASSPGPTGSPPPS